MAKNADMAQLAKAARRQAAAKLSGATNSHMADEAAVRAFQRTGRGKANHN